MSLKYLWASIRNGSRREAAHARRLDKASTQRPGSDFVVRDEASSSELDQARAACESAVACRLSFINIWVVGGIGTILSQMAFDEGSPFVPAHVFGMRRNGAAIIIGIWSEGGSGERGASGGLA